MAGVARSALELQAEADGEDGFGVQHVGIAAAVFRSVDAIVTRYTWSNPHTIVEFNVADPSGTGQTWNAECSSINMLGRKGWRSRSLKVGDKLKSSSTRTRRMTNLAFWSAPPSRMAWA